MNKRQKKKAFKKRFGYNPKDIEMAVIDDLPAIIKNLGDAVNEVVNSMIEAIPKVIDEVIKFLNENAETIKELQRRAQDEGLNRTE